MTLRFIHVCVLIFLDFFLLFNFCLFCSHSYFKQKQHSQQLPTLVDEQISNIENHIVAYTAVQASKDKTNQISLKDHGVTYLSNIDARKPLKKGLDASSITEKFNLKAVTVNRSSLSRRLSSNNSSSDTPSLAKMSPTVGSDTSTNSSSMSGFGLNMFQTKRPFAVKAFTKPQREQLCSKESTYLQSETMQIHQDSNIFNHNNILSQGRTDAEHSANISSSKNMNLLSQTTQTRTNLSSFPGASGFPRLHDFADPLPSPASAVASLTRDLESDLNQLELRDWAVQGQYVVKPQVTQTSY